MKVINNEINLEIRRESFVKRSVTSILYILLYIYIHINYLSVAWGYFGYALNDTSIDHMLISILIAYFPIIFYRGVLRISSFFSILIYIFGYVPIILTLIYDSNSRYLIILIYQISIMFGMILFFMIDKVDFSVLFEIRKFKKIPFGVIHIITIALTIYIFIIFKGRMSFVSFTDVYDLRSSNQALVSENMTGYFIMWLAYCLYPLYFTIGLINRKYKYLFIGMVGALFLYTITGSKASLLEPAIIFVFFLLLNFRKFISFFQLFFFAIAFMYMLVLSGNNILSLLVGSVFFMRTLSIAGLLTPQYLDFFQDHRLTYFSHVNVINMITHGYPYGNESLGTLLGYHYYHKEVNSNAIFWATDGIAAMGSFGVIIISIIVAFFFAFLNSNFKNSNNFMLLIFTPAILTILNASFFTTLLSGGLLFLIIILLIFQIPLTENCSEIN